MKTLFFFLFITSEKRDGVMMNLARIALLAGIMFLAVTACKSDEPNQKGDDKVDLPPPPVLPLPPSPAISVQTSFFGMHAIMHTAVPWPPISKSFSSIRLWDVGVFWASLNPSEGVFDWTKMDPVVKKIQDNDNKILYVLGGFIPQWASTNPNGTGCPYGNGTCYAPTIDAWKKFVTAITTRYDGNHGYGKIDYWEIWNEPNTPFWGEFWGKVSDSYTKMVELAKAAYPIIKAADPNNVVVSPSPQGSNGYKWLDPYFAAGGDQYTDAIAFHSYLFGGQPELVTPFVENVEAVQAKYPALAGKPLWDTEHCWGDDFSSNPWLFAANDDEQSAWIARHKIVSALSGIKGSFWYMWNGWEGQPHYGWLYNQTGKIIRKPGIAYNEVYKWLVNADIGTGTITGSSSLEGVYQCQLARPNGYKGLIVWASSENPRFTKTFTVPDGYIKYRTLDGKTVDTSGGSVLTLTMKPILLENK
jgi:hypothetical protein